MIQAIQLAVVHLYMVPNISICPCLYS